MFFIKSNNSKDDFFNGSHITYKSLINDLNDVIANAQITKSYCFPLLKSEKNHNIGLVKSQIKKFSAQLCSTLYEISHLIYLNSPQEENIMSDKKTNVPEDLYCFEDLIELLMFNINRLDVNLNSTFFKSPEDQQKIAHILSDIELYAQDIQRHYKNLSVL